MINYESRVRVLTLAKSNKMINIHWIKIIKIGAVLFFSIAPFFCVNSFGKNRNPQRRLNTSLTVQMVNEDIDIETQHLYDKIFNLEFDYTQKTEDKKIKTPLYLVVEDFRDMLFILLTEDKKNYEKLAQNEEKRLEELEKFEDKKNKYYEQYKWAKAEIKLHWAIVKLSFDEKWASAWRVRQAYKLLLENEEEFPNFIYHKKSLALLQITLASVPKKYQWALDFIGMEADIKNGIKNLEKSASQEHFFQKETLLWKMLFQTYLSEGVLENTEPSKPTAIDLLKKYPSERLVLLASSLVLMKNESHKTALLAWQNYAKDEQNNPFEFEKKEYSSLEYLLAELYFYSEQPQKAKFHYLNFLKNTASVPTRNFIKDSYYKLFLIEWLENEKTDFEYDNNIFFNHISQKGTAKTAVDRNAQKFAELVKENKHLPNKTLYQARILTDGGNYRKASLILRQVSQKQLQEWENDEQFETVLEYYYRRARVSQKGLDISSAVYFHKLVIEYSTLHNQNEIYYFAANSALQLGFIHKKIDKEQARKYFEMAISFKGHQYEDSITQKAKLALEKL